MILKYIEINNYKNLKTENLSFKSKITAFVGKNGVGKTNLLDAIYYLCIGKSYFNAIDSQNICFNTSFFNLKGTFSDQAQAQKTIFIAYQDKKIIKLNDLSYTRLADHVGQFTVVFISPTDTELITESSEVRRRFIDGIISQCDAAYLQALVLYNKFLAQRSFVLKQYVETKKIDLALLEVINEQMYPNAQIVFETRLRFFADFEPLFVSSYQSICQSAEPVRVQYLSQLQNDTLQALFVQAAAHDRAAGRSTMGVHKDEINFFIAEKPLKKFGSQGQQKSYIIALKLAQYHYIHQKTGTKPLLLLDDIFEKLDRTRLNSLMGMVSENHFGQIFITDTDAERVTALFEQIAQPIAILPIV